MRCRYEARLQVPDAPDRAPAHRNKAFDGFFRRVKARQTPGYPRFKGKGRFDSVEWPKDGDGARWRPDTGQVYLQGIGQVKVSAHRPVSGRVKTIQVRERDGVGC
jgi:putative transposase